MNREAIANLPWMRCFGCMAPDRGDVCCAQCGWKRGSHAQSVLHLRPGAILHETYLVGRALGQGGYGITYLGWDMRAAAKVAIKEYLPIAVASRLVGSTCVVPADGHSQDFDSGLDWFRGEAHIHIRLLNHPSIVSARDYFEENGTGYLVMEYLDGMTLDEALARGGGKLPYDNVVSLMSPVCLGLEMSHAHAIDHCDIRPDNIFLTHQGQVKILDFGSAQLREDLKARLWDPETDIARPGYTPEELIRRNGKRGPWTDVYSVGAVCYRSITGVVPPFALDRLFEDRVLGPREMGIDIPAELEIAILRAMAVRAAFRFQTVGEFRNAVLKFARTLRFSPDADTE